MFVWHARFLYTDVIKNASSGDIIIAIVYSGTEIRMQTNMLNGSDCKV